MRTDNEMGHLARIIHVKDTESQSQEVLKIIEDIPINQKSEFYIVIIYRVYLLHLHCLKMDICLAYARIMQVF